MSDTRQHTSHAHGSPCWFELGTTDQARAEAFYAAVFGWDAEHHPMPDGSVYTLFRIGGREVAAAYTLMPEQTAQGVPPNWGVYFKADDADATTAAAAAAGAQVLSPPMDIQDMLRMAVLADPEGAAFMLDQPRAHPGVAAIREPNAVCWVELATRDIVAAERFYTGLFGWSMQDHAASPVAYRMFGNGDGQLGGLLQMTAEWGEMPAHWSLYFQVEDVDAAVATALERGGALQFPAFDAPGVGRIARIDDPSGAGFYVIRFVDGIA